MTDLSMVVSFMVVASMYYENAVGLANLIQEITTEKIVEKKIQGSYNKPDGRLFHSHRHGTKSVGSISSLTSLNTTLNP